jgi:hypothetical protein
MLLQVKFITVFILLLLSPEISKGQLNNGNIESGEITRSQCYENESLEMNCMNLKLTENGSRPINHGEKVETIVITCPIAYYSDVRIINLLCLQNISFSKRKNSLTSHHNLLISKTSHLSPLVNILQI